MLRVEGYAAAERAYDAQGWMVREAYFDLDGQPAYRVDPYAPQAPGDPLPAPDNDARAAGFAAWNIAYDAVGKPVQEWHFDDAGQPVAGRLSSQRCAGIR